MDITANELTKWAKDTLTKRGYFVVRINNTPVKGRKGIITKGVPDLLGCTKHGVLAGVEVKKIGDKLSQDQIDLMTYLDALGCEMLICTEVENKPSLIKFTDYVITKKK